MTTSRVSRLAPWVASTAAYVALTLVFTWPLAARMSSSLPHDLGDPLLVTWILWWNAHVTPLTEAWWNAPFFWPTHGVTAFAEHLLGISLLATPLQWLGAGPVTAYNAAFLLTFPLSAIGAHALALRLTRRHDAAFIAGLIYGFNPYRTSQLSHLQVIWSFWMPFGLMALHAYRDDRRVRWLVLFAVMVLGQSLGNLYFLMFFPVLIATWAVWSFDVRRESGRLLQIGVALALALAPVAPILLAYRRLHAGYGLARGLGEMRVFSADLLSLTWAAPEVALWSFRSSGANSERQLFFGLTALVVAALALIADARRVPRGPAPWPRVRAVAAATAVGFAALTLLTAAIGPWRIAIGGWTIATLGAPFKPLSIAILGAVVVLLDGRHVVAFVRERSTFIFYAAAAVGLFVLCMGPDPAVLGARVFYWGPWRWMTALPGFNGVRVPARFAMLVTLCLSAAAALGFVALVSRLPKPRVRLAAALVVAGILADSWIHGLAIVPIPDRLAVEERLPGNAPILELPLGEPLPDLAAMYRAMYHGHPVVNGWSGYFPVHYDLLRFVFKTPRKEAVAALAGLGTALTVVVDTRTPEGAEWATLVALHGGGTEIGGEAGRRVFSLPAPHVQLDDFSARRLPMQAVTTNTTPVDLRQLIDDDPATGWLSPTPQRGDEAITIDLGDVRRVEGVTLGLGRFFDGFPRALAIDTSADGVDWKPRPTLSPLTVMIGAARLRPREVPMPFRLDGVPARYIRLRQLGQDPLALWAFAELAVYGN
ncbi:MAG: discoidin domain-containing protein [Acidobacteria bacterium]|nr:discoidin domain-containing protein [Acidobacteriota bacterium]